PRALDGPVDVDVVGDERLRFWVGRAQIAAVVLVGSVARDRDVVGGTEPPQQQALRAEGLLFGTPVFIRSDSLPRGAAAYPAVPFSYSPSARFRASSALLRSARFCRFAARFSCRDFPFFLSLE